MMGLLMNPYIHKYKTKIYYLTYILGYHISNKILSVTISDVWSLFPREARSTAIQV